MICKNGDLVIMGIAALRFKDARTSYVRNIEHRSASQKLVAEDRVWNTSSRLSKKLN